MIGRGFESMLEMGIAVGVALLCGLIVLFAYEAFMDRRK